MSTEISIFRKTTRNFIPTNISNFTERTFEREQFVDTCVSATSATSFTYYMIHCWG